MMTRLPSIVLTLSLAFCLLLVSCAKDGPTGPAGAAGNADVRTHVVTLADSNFVLATYWLSTGPGAATGRQARAATIVDSSITRGIVDSGTVLVYFRPSLIGSDSSWEQLPVSMLSFGDTYWYKFASRIGIASVKIYYWHESNTTGTAPPAVTSVVVPTRPFKYIVISGSSLTLMKARGVNVSNFDEVTGFLQRLTLQQNE
jgi:hypothetical protein